MTDSLTWLIKVLESTRFPATDPCEWRDRAEALDCLVCGEFFLWLTGIGLNISQQSDIFSVRAASVYPVKC